MPRPRAARSRRSDSTNLPRITRRPRRGDPSAGHRARVGPPLLYQAIPLFAMSVAFDSRPRASRLSGIRPSMVRAFAVGCLYLFAAGVSRAAEIRLAWDPVDDPRVAGYQVHHGPASRDYSDRLDATGPEAVVGGLEPGRRYYFAVRACAADGVTCSGFSNEVSAEASALPPAPPVVDWSADPVIGPAPLEVRFTDRSTGRIDHWAWDFGDGSTGEGQGATHTYVAPGTYAVSLAVTGPDGTSRETRPGYIQVLPPPPVASFSVTAVKGVAPLTTVFTDNSSGQVSGRSWSFGDGGTSTASTAVHTYAAPGSYTVSLTVNGPGGSHTRTSPGLVEVTAPRSRDVGPGPSLLEAGEVTVDHQWRWVAFSAPFADPIVDRRAPERQRWGPGRGADRGHRTGRVLGPRPGMGLSGRIPRPGDPGLSRHRARAPSGRRRGLGRGG